MWCARSSAGRFAKISTIATEIGDRNLQFESLYGLGHVHRAAGRLDLARGHWQQALGILTALGLTDAEELTTEQIRDHLASITGDSPQAPQPRRALLDGSGNNVPQ